MQSFVEIMKNMINYSAPTQPVLTCSTLNNYRDSTDSANELRTVMSQPLYNSIIKTNSWSIESLVTFTENSLNIAIGKMTAGIPKLKDTDPSQHELCSRVLNNQKVPLNNLAATSMSKIEFGGRRKSKSKSKRQKTRHIRKNKRRKTRRIRKK
jgi:hypothetical protein